MIETTTAQFSNEADLVDRLGKALALAKIVEQEFKSIRLRSLMIGADWGSTTESLLAHLELDLDWLQKEFGRIWG